PIRLFILLLLPVLRTAFHEFRVHDNPAPQTCPAALYAALLPGESGWALLVSFAVMNQESCILLAGSLVGNVTLRRA
ncbi:hypothetical protein AB4Z54_17100, partial [Streptomyces sp. MCAF7]